MREKQLKNDSEMNKSSVKVSVTLRALLKFSHKTNDVH